MFFLTGSRKRTILLSALRSTGMLLSFGLSLGSALEALCQIYPDCLNRREGLFLGGLMSRLAQDIATGSTLSEALIRHPRLFDADALGKIKEAEMQGSLPQALAALGAEGDAMVEGLAETAPPVVVALVNEALKKALEPSAASLAFPHPPGEAAASRAFYIQSEGRWSAHVEVPEAFEGVVVRRLLYMAGLPYWHKGSALEGLIKFRAGKSLIDLRVAYDPAKGCVLVVPR